MAAVPARAAANPTGGVFAGPVRPNGSSAYYNPAALADLRGPFVALIETGLVNADVSYQRQGLSPASGAAFSPVGFSLLAPTFDASLVVPTPWRWLSWGVAGFSPSAASADWPEDGPQAQHGTEALFLSYSVVTGPIVRGRTFGFAAMVGPTFTRAGLRYAFDFGSFANDSVGAPLFSPEDPALIGFVDASSSGWSLAASFGGWYAPTDWLRLGAGFLWLESPQLDGDLEVEPPPAFDETFPNQRFRIASDVGLVYKLPWILNLEAEAELGRFVFAVMFQYQNKSIRDVNVFSLTETEPDVLDANVVSVTNGEDDWMVGGRLSYRFSPSFELGARFDLDPLAVPKETLHPVNLDFTSYEMGVGAQWWIGDRWLLSGSYAFVLVPDLVVSESIFDPSAPGDSGFALPSANGSYSVTAMKFLVSLRARLGE